MAATVPQLVPHSWLDRAWLSPSLQDVVQDREWLKKPPNGPEGRSMKISTVQRLQPGMIEAFNSMALAKEAKKAETGARRAAKGAALKPGKGQSTIREVRQGYLAAATCCSGR